MRKLAWGLGDSLTVAILSGVAEPVEGTFHKIEGRYLRLRLSPSIRCGALVRVETAGGDTVLGEIVHSQSELRDMTVVECEQVLFAEDLEGIWRIKTVEC
jgi:hypothetical protein